MRAPLLEITALLAGFLALSACEPGGGVESPGSGYGSGTSSGTSSAKKWAWEREFSGGPVSLVLRLDTTEAKLSDQITLQQELRVEGGFEADFPEYLPEDFEGFAVVDIREQRPEDDLEAASREKPGEDTGGSSVRRLELTLEPDRSGDLAIAPLAVYFHRTGEEEETELLTEEVPIHVEPVEDIGELEVRDPRGILDAPPAESDGGYLGWVLAVAGGLAVAALLLVCWLRRPRKAPPPIPPHEVAYEQLRRLVALDLIEKGEIERFFVLLSGILREYIERRFLVHAPERTTEEFLEEATRHPALDVHRARLAQFLGLCDQVKFARYEPDPSAIQGAFDVTKQFLSETTPHASEN